MIPTIETERLILRAPEADDFPVYRDFFADADASRFMAGRWTPAAHGGCSPPTSGTGRCSELTWWIVPAARRMGYAAEASRGAIGFGYRTLGWDVVETHMNDANVAARQLAEKLGGTVLTRECFPDGLERNIYALPDR